jgi:hypothetical protein
MSERESVWYLTEGFGTAREARPRFAALPNTESFDRSTQHEQTWTVGGKAGGIVGKKDAANAGAELSAQFQDKVVNSLKDTSTQTVTTIKWTELSRSTGSWTNL